MCHRSRSLCDWAVIRRGRQLDHQGPDAHTPALLGLGDLNGTRYAVAGLGEGVTVLGTLEACDPRSGRWTTKTPMPTPRYGLGVGVVNGVLCTEGGYGIPGAGVLPTVQAYDPTTDAWTRRASLPTPRFYLEVTVVDGSLHAIGRFYTSIVAAGTP